MAQGMSIYTTACTIAAACCIQTCEVVVSWLYTFIITLCCCCCSCISEYTPFLTSLFVHGLNSAGGVAFSSLHLRLKDNAEREKERNAEMEDREREKEKKSQFKFKFLYCSTSRRVQFTADWLLSLPTPVINYKYFYYRQ